MLFKSHGRMKEGGTSHPYTCVCVKDGCLAPPIIYNFFLFTFILFATPKYLTQKCTCVGWGVHKCLLMNTEKREGVQN